jgi:polyisoprenoid-binding protein YceI
LKSALCLLLALFVSPSPAAELYRLGSDNTQIIMVVRILGVTLISARFYELSGELVPVRRASPSRVDVTVETASLVCENARWNARLLSSVWFDAQHYPQIIFHSERVELDAPGGPLVSGRLTLHGQTRAFELSVSRWVCAEHPNGADACSFDAEGHLRRSDYGLPHGILEGGDDVQIQIRGTAVPAPT